MEGNDFFAIRSLIKSNEKKLNTIIDNQVILSNKGIKSNKNQVILDAKLNKIVSLLDELDNDIRKIKSALNL